VKIALLCHFGKNTYLWLEQAQAEKYTSRGVEPKRLRRKSPDRPCTSRLNVLNYKFKSITPLNSILRGIDIDNKETD
jgi:hypothetical protein